MSKTDQTYSTLLDELGKTLKEKTPAEIIALLRNSRTTVSNDADIQFVVLSVCNQTGIPIQDLVHEPPAGDLAKYTKGFIVHYLRSDFDVDWNSIKNLLRHKSQSYLWKLTQLVKTLKPYLAAQADFHAHKVTLDQVIKDYKSKK